MQIYGNQVIDTRFARIDVDAVAFHVQPDEAGFIAEYLTSAISTRCLMDFGEHLEILE